jgi:hypothetical protein
VLIAVGNQVESEIGSTEGENYLPALERLNGVASRADGKILEVKSETFARAAHNHSARCLAFMETIMLRCNG